MNDAPDPHQRISATAAAGQGARARRSPARIVADALRRRVRLLLGIWALVIGVTMLATLLQQPLFTATAEVVLDTTDRGAALSAGAATGRADTEARIIRSREMARAVATALQLQRDPAFLRAAADDGIGSRIAHLFRSDRAGQGGGSGSRQVIDTLGHGLATRQLEDTLALAIDFTSPDPDVAARVATGVARQYSVGQLAAAAPGASPLDRPNARIISEAEPPLVPSSPRPWRNLAIAIVAGALLGAIAAILVERALSGLTSSRDIEERLGLHHLGSVPTLASVLPDARSPFDAVVAAPMSGFAEAFRSVMMAIRYAGGRGTQAIAITSSLPNEGKTTIAACLARSIALGGESVVLIDCDARRRDTSALFGAGGGGPGLAEVLRYEATLDEALIRDTASGAWILPLSGPPEEISELLAGAPMVAVIENLRRRFKRILIDTAPILPISNTRAIVTMVDLVVIVVRWRATRDHAVQAALRLLPHEHVRIGGVVLSQVDMARQVKYGQGDPAFYYKQYEKYYS